MLANKLYKYVEETMGNAKLPEVVVSCICLLFLASPASDALHRYLPSSSVVTSLISNTPEGSSVYLKQV